MCIRTLARAALLCLTLAGAHAQEPPRQITFGDSRDCDPMVSPDGNLVAFSSNRTGNFDIFVFNYKTNGTYQLTTSEKDDRYPAFSADSTRIVFSSDRTDAGDIYEVKADGSSGFLQLTDGEKLEEYPSYRHGDANALLYSLRVKRLPRPEMQVVYRDRSQRGGAVRVLADGDEARFSPDGRKIVFVSRRTKDNEIWLMNVDGTMQTQLTTSPRDDDNPCFSPDGKSIVFASKRTGNYDLWVMTADGREPRQLTSGPEDETQPCWSSGGYIYYTRKAAEGVSHIFRIKAP